VNNVTSNGSFGAIQGPQRANMWKNWAHVAPALPLHGRRVMSAKHHHRDIDDRVRFLEDMIFRLFLGLVAGGFIVISALIGLVAVLLAR
jgi:hypothetical protein